VKTISQSIYYINLTTCFGVFDHNQVYMNKNNKYTTFMLNFMMKTTIFNVIKLKVVYALGLNIRKYVHEVIELLGFIYNKM
jgi:hypothetical protein